MGAWTSTFMIGISNRLYPPFLQLKDTSQSTYEESEGFEPPDLLQSIVFKTTSFDRSDNSPYILVGGGKRTRTSEPEGADLQSAAIATMRYSQLEQVVRFELTSPVWKTRALTSVLYLLMWTR